MAKTTNVEKCTYEVRSPVEYDLERYELGETIELTPAVAAQLLACGAIAELAIAAVKKP